MKIRFLFSIVASILLITFLVIINILTSPQFPWSLFPVFGVLWWPLSIYCYDKKSPLRMAVLGSLITIVFFIVVNQITSSNFYWCIFPIFGVLWWPLSVFSNQKKSPMLMASLGSLLLAALIIGINLITSPGFAWSIFPLFSIVWWPLSVYCGQNKKFKLFSILGSLLIIILLLITNYITTKKIDWSLYTVFPILFWPIGMFFKKYLKSMGFYFIIGIITIGYYVLLNGILSPGFPWSIFVAYEILLLIAGSYFWHQKKEFWFYVSGLIISLIFLAVILWLIGLNTLWVYEIALLSVSVQFFIYLGSKRKYYSLIILSSIIVLSYLILNNLLYSPQHLWFLYALLPISWLWVMMVFTKQVKTFWFALFSAIIGIIYYAMLNLLMSPGHLWVIYPAFALFWWPLSVYYARTKNHLLYAIIGSLILIIFFISINFLTTPNILWCIFPIFLVLWWPLSIYFFIYKKNKLMHNK